MDDVTLSTQSGYPRDRAKAALSVLLDVAHVLAEYRDEIVVVGGWVPALLIPDGLVTHTGSLDVDLAVDHRVLAHREHYATMLALLERSGYVQDSRQPFIYHRALPDSILTVEVDLRGSMAGPAERTVISASRTRCRSGRREAWTSPTTRQ